MPPGNERSELDGVPLPSVSEQLVQGRYAVACGSFKPATLHRIGPTRRTSEHAAAPPRFPPIKFPCDKKLRQFRARFKFMTRFS